MIGLDTNVVVRFLVEDDEKQTKQVRRLLEAAIEAREPCLLTDAVLCETEWVLESCYDAERRDISLAVQRLVSAAHFTFEDRMAVGKALDRYQAGKADFSDYLIGLRGRSLGARTTFTFDRDLRSSEEFTVL